MKIIRLRHFPLGKNFYAINICGIVFARDTLSAIEQNHEFIHSLQQREMMVIFFYLWYLAEWLVKLIYYRNFYKSYTSISFEREAYCNEKVIDYRLKRSHYAWVKLL